MDGFIQFHVIFWAKKMEKTESNLILSTTTLAYILRVL